MYQKDQAEGGTEGHQVAPGQACSVNPLAHRVSRGGSRARCVQCAGKGTTLMLHGRIPGPPSTAGARRRPWHLEASSPCPAERAQTRWASDRRPKLTLGTVQTPVSCLLRSDCGAKFPVRDTLKGSAILCCCTPPGPPPSRSPQS